MNHATLWATLITIGIGLLVLTPATMGAIGLWKMREPKPLGLPSPERPDPRSVADRYQSAARRISALADRAHEQMTWVLRDEGFAGEVKFQIVVDLAQPSAPESDSDFLQSCGIAPAEGGL